MAFLAGNYLSVCEKATIQPDVSPVARLTPIFAKLKGGESSQ